MTTKTAAQIAAKLSRAQTVAIPTLLTNYVHAAPITIKALESRGLIERRGAGRMQSWKLTVEGQKVSCLIYGTTVELDHAEALEIVARASMVPAIQVAITDADDEAVTSIDGAVEAMQQALGDPDYSAELVEDMSDGLWLVALPASDAAELRENGYWGRENEDGYSVEAEWPSEGGRGDHFGSCARCGISYEVRSAEQAIEDHDMYEGHAFIPSDPA